MLRRELRSRPVAPARLVLHHTWAPWLVLALWAPYAALNTLFPGPLLTYALGLLLAALALGVLLRSGESPQALYLRLALPSRLGVLILVLLLLVFIPGALLAGRGQAFSALDALVFAPASALGQELYF